MAKFAPAESLPSPATLLGSDKKKRIFYSIFQLNLMLQSEDGGDLSGFMPNGNHHHHHPSPSLHHHNYPYHHQHCSNLRWVEYAWYAGKTEFNCLWICWTGTLHRHHILYQHKVTIHSSIDKCRKEKTLPKAQRTLGLSSSCQSHIASSSTNLDRISSSECRPSINFKISTKHQHIDYHLNFKILTIPCAQSLMDQT